MFCGRSWRRKDVKGPDPALLKFVTKKNRMEGVGKIHVKEWFQNSMVSAGRRKHRGEIISSSFISNTEEQVVVSRAQKRAKKIISSV